MDTARKVVVVGAGAWGLSCALALLESGVREVRVMERLHAGSGATALAAGLVSTHLRQSQDIALVLRTRRRIQALREWGLAQGRPSAQHVFNPVGSVTLVPQPEEDKLVRLRRRIHSEGGSAEPLTGVEVEKRWPLVGLGAMSALWSPEDGHVEGGDLVDLLQARVRDLGGKVLGDRAVALRSSQHHITGVESTGSFEACDAVVVAAGAWTKRILAQAGLAVPLKAYRTQLAQVGYAHSGTFPVLHDSALRVYARPDGDDAILVGDGTEFTESEPDAFDKGADGSFIEKVAASVSARVKGGSEALYRHGWAGLCVSTPDRDPLIGAYPGVGGLYVMAGDNGFGVMRSLALGEHAAAAVLGKPDPTFSLDRFDLGQDFEIREGFEL